MKKASVFLFLTILSTCFKSKAQQMEKLKFKSEKVSRTATILLNGKIETVFPLFGAFEERKWAPYFQPELIWPATEVIEEGTIFRTASRGFGETEFIWRVIKFDVEKHLVQYLVYTENRQWTITIKCNSINGDKTEAQITYTFIGLNEKGNELNKKIIEDMYQSDLKDWEEEINPYLLKNTTPLKN